MHVWLRAKNNLQEGNQEESRDGWRIEARRARPTAATDQISCAETSGVCMIQVVQTFPIL